MDTTPDTPLPTPEPDPVEPEPVPAAEQELEDDYLVALVDRVNDRTAGNRHDYLTRGDVEQIVKATLDELDQS